MSNSKADGNGHHNENTIIINARPKKFSGDEISYEEVVQLAFTGSVDPNIIYTVTFVGPKIADGTLTVGQSVQIKNGMKFDVNKTNRS